MKSSLSICLLLGTTNRSNSEEEHHHCSRRLERKHWRRCLRKDTRGPYCNTKTNKRALKLLEFSRYTNFGCQIHLGPINPLDDGPGTDPVENMTTRSITSRSRRTSGQVLTSAGPAASKSINQEPPGPGSTVLGPRLEEAKITQDWSWIWTNCKTPMEQISSEQLEVCAAARPRWRRTWCQHYNQDLRYSRHLNSQEDPWQTPPTKKRMETTGQQISCGSPSTLRGSGTGTDGWKQLKKSFSSLARYRLRRAVTDRNGRSLCRLLRHSFGFAW